MPRLLQEQEDDTELVPHGYHEGDHSIRTIHGPETGNFRSSSPPQIPNKSLLENPDESERQLRPEEVSDIVKDLKRHKGLTPKHLEAPEGYDVPHLRILGVMVDSQLKWGPHNDYIAKKVKTQQYNFWHISRTQTGPKLQQMRQLYMAKVLPIFSYACGAWYLARDACAKYKMNSAYIEELEKLHKSFLLDVSGCMKGTLAEVLFKELHIHRMSTFLEKTAIVQRARELDTPQHKELCRIRARAWLNKRSSPGDRHPYHQLDTIERKMLDDALNPRPGNEFLDLRKCVKQLADQRAEEASRAAWEDHKLAYITNRPGRIPAAYSDPQGWGRHNLERYADLPRYLEEARARELVLRVGTKHVDELLANHSAEASAFAVLHFGICKDNQPQKGGQQEEEEKKKKKGGSTKAARRKEQQQRQRRRHEKQGGGGKYEKQGGERKCKKSKAQRRADKTRKIWKMKRRREAVEG
ncbi:hypothetical protein INS49_005044 [Diaporthe citri]|uniref:uncharacterized protein n=1 Tax=Diaporthe citri TaxID=83186 RepID=UPI001C7E7284|nr:uncharacterized protein INS49_005044 [Diaporthe citri]KAG6354073.1 hypothetical protein INS49_005044 [Diaporthe citri]